MTSWAAAFRIPLIGARRAQAETEKLDQSLRPISVVKPSRRLGATWISDKVAQRRPVVLCGECLFRYRNWWKREHYKADWGWNYVGDCDGCGLVSCRVTFFHAEERFYDVLTRAHGRNPQP